MSLCINHRIIHIYIEQHSSIFHLLTGYSKSLCILFTCYQSQEFSTSGNITTLADIYKRAIIIKRLQSCQPSCTSLHSLTRFYPLDSLRHSGNMVRGRATASTDNIYNSSLGKSCNMLRHHLRSLVIFAHCIRQTCIRISTYITTSYIAQLS